MAPLIALVVVTLLARLAGSRGLARDYFATWSGALRAGVAALFVVTGCAHFVGLRAQRTLEQLVFLAAVLWAGFGRSGRSGRSGPSGSSTATAPLLEG
jgi:hypothetical protein